MGLAVSQIRLLALTTRKADIELQMQVNSKRKQALTRKSTELSQQYYNKLKNTNIQYATNNGYEDVTFNYLMGQTYGEGYSTRFLQQIKTGSSKNNIAQKFVNNMILTDQYGQVVLNDEMAKIIKKTQDSYPVGVSNVERTAQAIVELINERRKDVFTDLFLMYASDSEELKLSSIEKAKKDKIVSYLMMLIENGGYKNGGKVYTPDNGGTFYSNALAAQQGNDTERVILEKGAIYSVADPYGTTWNGLLGNIYTGGTGADAFDKFLTQDQIEYLGNLAAYFGPMISAALQNGTTSKVSSVLTDGVDKGHYTIDDYNNYRSANSFTGSIEEWLLADVLQQNGDICVYTDSSTGKVTYYHNSGGVIEAYDNSSDINSHLIKPNMNMDAISAMLPNDGDWCIITDTNGQHYYKNRGGSVSEIDPANVSSECSDISKAVNSGLGITVGDYFHSLSEAKLYLKNNGDVGMIKDNDGNITYVRNQFDKVEPYVPDGGAAGFYSNFTYIVDNNDKYVTASKVESLQQGFKSGTFQLCMVSDVVKGQYHKNTTMEYFTHMQYVVDKADTSMREEVTAWFNTEQAALSEQETYWDSEIQNLSTELTAVNQEIDSVKNLKSNSIKSVFNWGGS